MRSWPIVEARKELKKKEPVTSKVPSGPVVVTPRPAVVGVSVRTPIVMVTSSFARDWFMDALREARSSDRHSRRREILFAVCFIESYLLEWVRDEVLTKRHRGRVRSDDALAKYFPYGGGGSRRQGIRSRWKNVLKELKKDGCIPNAPDFSDRYWSEFQILVDYRDGLVHARASRPEIPHQSDEAKPRPTLAHLDQIHSGWAAEVVFELVKRLHDAAGTRQPKWLVKP